MIEQIKSPPIEFEDVVKLHFKIKRNQIVKQCSLWLKEASKSKTNGHFERMKKLVEELTKELENLDPTLPLEEISEEELVDPEELARWNKAVELTEIIPGFPLSIYVKALEISKDKADAAVSWLLDKGDAYQWEHPELITLKPPKKADKALKFLSKIN